MKRVAYVIALVLLVAVSGCVKKEKTALTIGNIEITAKEFDEAFKMSGSADKKDANRKEFLDNFINRKLILKEAENLGVNKDPEFLKSIQMFWEQSLLKLALDRKSKALFMRIQVTDQEIRNFYEKNKEQHFANKDISKVYDAIKILMLREKEKLALQGWVNSLRKKTKIDINYKLLGITQN